MCICNIVKYILRIFKLINYYFYDYYNKNKEEEIVNNEA